MGVDVRGEGNCPAQSKHQAFTELTRPRRWSDLRMLIGCFGFYSRWLLLFEVKIAPWRAIISKQPKPGTCTIKEEEAMMTALWGPQEEALLEELKQAIVEGPMLARPDPSRRFYVKTDWSKEGIGAVLLQAEDTPEARKAEREEIEGGKCEFK